MIGLEARLWSKIQVGPPDQCWPWLGGTSRGGRREVEYGCLRAVHPRRLYRAHRLSLLLASLPEGLDDREVLGYLRLAELHYAGLEASHTCDRSLCCNPAHLAWESHPNNVIGQRRRREAA